MERELFAYLGFKVNVGNVELQAFVRGLDQGQIRSVGESPVVAASPPMPSPAPEVVAPPPVVQPTQHDQAVEAAAMSSPASSASSAGPHRASVAHRASRHGGSMSINNRASIAGYPASHSAAAAAAAATAANAMMGSGSAPPITSSSMARCASVKHDRPSSAHAHLHHSFGVNARDRGRPYTMPTHSMPLAGHSASAGGHYACQPRPSSLSSPSIASRGSISAGSSSGSSASATPSPSASHSVSSSSTTPDTPPSELAVSPYGHSGPFGPTSPSAMPAGTYEKTHGQFQLYLQNAQRGNYIHQLSQQELYTSAIPTA